MGELVFIQQPRSRRGPLPATLGVLGSSKGNSYAVGGSVGPAPAVGPVNPAQVAAVLQTLNTIANPEPPQKITATGETMPGAIDKARRLRPPPPPPAPVYVPVPYSPIPYAVPVSAAVPTVAPGAPFPGGGGGGAAAGGDDQAAAADPPVFLGLTQKQLVIGGGVALVAYLLLRKKRPGGAPAAEGV